MDEPERMYIRLAAACQAKEGRTLVSNIWKSLPGQKENPRRQEMEELVRVLERAAIRLLSETIVRVGVPQPSPQSDA